MNILWSEYYSWSKRKMPFFVFASEFCIEQMLQEQCDHKAFFVYQLGQMLDC